MDTDLDIPEPKYINLVLSGGSIRSIAQVGAIKVLVDKQLIDLKKLKSVAGSSAGALLGLLITLGYSIDEIWDFLYWLDMKNLVKPNLLKFLERCGLDTGEIIINLIEDILQHSTDEPNITFGKLYTITNIHLTIVGSCLTTKEAVYYDHINTPDFSVGLAIRISISMPIFFTPVEHENKKYVDGAILNDYPMNLFENELDKTIGIMVCNNYDTDYKYPEEYLFAILNLFLHKYTIEYMKYESNTINVCDFGPNMSIFNFDINNEKKLELYEKGIMAAEKFLAS